MSLLEVEGFTKRFGGLVAVDSVDLTVGQGEIVGLIGPNGAGKSTLFSMIAGDQRPTSGRMVFAGRDVTGWPPHRAAAAGVGRTFQLMRGFPTMTVRENVRAAAHLRHRSRSAASQAADAVIGELGLDDVADRLASTLTAASRKQLEVARALATEPRILLLDEVLSGLTPTESRRSVETILGLHRRGLTIVMVEHVLEVIMGLCERVVVLHQGAKLSEGPPSAVVSDPAVVEAYLGSGRFAAEDSGTSGGGPSSGASNSTVGARGE
ncbi:MAG: branched-chain amino acid transport system ATP-binding protein [Actinomycetota bacterium]|nr:branched-chain amino acid transport system ATP-binding protein [Actinomycetota bacterium]